MAIVPFVDQDTVLTLQQLTYHVRYTPSAKRCTVLFQEFEHIQYQLKDTHQNPLVVQLKLINYLIICLAMKILLKWGHKQQNIDCMEAT